MSGEMLLPPPGLVVHSWLQLLTWTSESLYFFRLEAVVGDTSWVGTMAERHFVHGRNTRTSDTLLPHPPDRQWRTSVRRWVKALGPSRQLYAMTTAGTGHTLPRWSAWKAMREGINNAAGASPERPFREQRAPRSSTFFYLE